MKDWDKLLTEKETVGGYFQRLGVVGENLFDWLCVAVPATLFLAFVVVMIYIVFRQHKTIEGHDYIRTGAYNFSHSQKCWCDK